MLHHGHAVGNEEITDAELFLQILHQVENLRLYGHIQRRNGLVADDDLRRYG